MSGLICWTLLDLSENLLDIIFAGRAFETFVLPTAQLYVSKISP